VETIVVAVETVNESSSDPPNPDLQWCRRAVLW
jgi:hypothetical protein